MKSMNSPAEEVVYHYIKDQIVSRALFPGTRILQEEVAQVTGVSRTPIKAAFERLSYEGLIDISPNKGASVANPSIDEITSAYECRLLLESEFAKLACGKISEEGLERMNECLNEQVEQLRVHDLQNFIDSNRRFHMEICKAVGNPFYELFLNQLFNKCDIYILFYDKFFQLSPETSPTLRAHRKIIDAFRKKNQSLCVELVRGDIQTTLDQLDINKAVRTVIKK
jgi:DNA-binding GntR family transcriptional regulator